ncbi:MAG: glycosyltransferase family 4 protein [Anaerolineaceae bacterium]|nr:glycosyltransferase family 4 protein [Anaerolineaceae bacterium]
MNPVLVLHAMNNCADGSITRIVERIIGCLGNRDFEWHVGGVKGLGESSGAIRNQGVTVIDFSSTPYQPQPSWQKIRRYVSDHRIQIIHSHTPRTIFEVGLALTMPGPRLRTPVVHVATKHLLTTPQDRSRGHWYTWVDRLTLYIPDCIVPVSNTMAREAMSLPGMWRKQVVPIPNGIPVEDYNHAWERESSRKELGIDPGAIAIGFTGRIAQVKRLDLLIEAFASLHHQYPNACLIIAGEGELSIPLQQLASRLGIPGAVRWTGFCKHIPRLLAALDIYVQPSVNEGLSLSILEAMAAGIPVIATRVGAAEEILQDGCSGILIEPGSASAIRQALLCLLQEPKERILLANAARQIVKDRFSLQLMTDSYRDLYASFVLK